jgi:hypothetical protein
VKPSVSGDVILSVMLVITVEALVSLLTLPAPMVEVRITASAVASALTRTASGAS